METFEGRVAVITGGTSGIGMACARDLLSQGAKVMVIGRSKDSTERALDYLKAVSPLCDGVWGDISDPDTTRMACDETVRIFGSLHLAVNSAGIEIPPSPVGQADIDQWNKGIAVNLSGVFYSCRAEINAMLESGRQDCAIVNIASIAGLDGMPGTPAYVAAKHGVVGLTKNIAIDYSRKGIRCNAIAPGYTRTPMLERAAQQVGDLSHLSVPGVKDGNLMGRFAMPEEVAWAASFLLGPKAAFITGVTLPVDGGWGTF